VSRRRLVAFPLAVLLSAALAPFPPARAQCVPDNLDSLPCCTPVAANLPVIPAVSQSAKYVCFNNCATQVNQNLCVDIDPPAPANLGGPICGIYLIRFKVKTCGGGQVLWQGNMRAHYSRNWLETDASGQSVGVWRFLLNGDFKASAFLQGTTQWSSPNVRPGCYTTFNAIYVAGYVDYAFDCTFNTWSAAWVLNHDCDSNHHPAGSPRPAPLGGFHPTRSFTFLGPGAGFVVDPSTTLTGGGAVGNEAVRWNDWSALPNICRTEEQVSGLVTKLGPSCPCSTIPGAPGQYEWTDVQLSGACGSAQRTIQPAIVPLWQKRIGRWTNPAVFPGIEYVNVDMGNMDYFNSCNGNFTTEFMEGVTTLGGFPATNYAFMPLGRTFMDLGSSNRSPNNLARRVGVPHITQYLVNIDLP